jgi:hypothetical protein
VCCYISVRAFKFVWRGEVRLALDGYLVVRSGKQAPKASKSYYLFLLAVYVSPQVFVDVVVSVQYQVVKENLYDAFCEWGPCTRRCIAHGWALPASLPL